MVDGSSLLTRRGPDDDSQCLDRTGSEIWESHRSREAEAAKSPKGAEAAEAELTLCTLVTSSVRGRGLQLSSLRQWAEMGEEQIRLSLFVGFIEPLV